MKYAAIMFDVVESRKYYDRYDVQNVLMGCVDYLNTIYEQGIKKIHEILAQLIRQKRKHIITEPK